MNGASYLKIVSFSSINDELVDQVENDYKITH